MDINNLQRTPSYSYRVDVDRIKQRFQQADKNRAVDQRQGDSVDISEEGRSALREKMSAIGRSGQTEDIGKLPSMNSGSYGMMNDFEKIMSELGGGSVSDDMVTKDYSQADVDVLKAKFEEKEGTRTDTFDSYVNTAKKDVKATAKQEEKPLTQTAGYRGRIRQSAASSGGCLPTAKRGRLTSYSRSPSAVSQGTRSTFWKRSGT